MTFHHCKDCQRCICRQLKCDQLHLFRTTKMKKYDFSQLQRHSKVYFTAVKMCLIAPFPHYKDDEIYFFTSAKIIRCIYRQWKCAQLHLFRAAKVMKYDFSPLQRLPKCISRQLKCVQWHLFCTTKMMKYDFSPLHILSKVSFPALKINVFWC